MFLKIMYLNFLYWSLGLALLPNLHSTSEKNKTSTNIEKTEGGNKTDVQVCCHSGLVFKEFIYHSCHK